MTAIKASTVKYGEPFVTKVGGVLFSVTAIEVPATEEEPAEGGFELLPEKLGLTDGLISVSSGVGGTASTTALAGAIWCDPVMVKAKEANEAGKQVAEAQIAAITLIAGVPFLRCFSIETAGIGKPFIEGKTATKVKIGLFTTTVYAFGR